MARVAHSFAPIRAIHTTHAIVIRRTRQQDTSRDCQSPVAAQSPHRSPSRLAPAHRGGAAWPGERRFGPQSGGGKDLAASVQDPGRAYGFSSRRAQAPLSRASADSRLRPERDCSKRFAIRRTLVRVQRSPWLSLEGRRDPKCWRDPREPNVVLKCSRRRADWRTVWSWANGVGAECKE